MSRRRCRYAASPLVLLISTLVLCSDVALAQEYLDTAGRWKTLNGDPWAGCRNGPEISGARVLLSNATDSPTTDDVFEPASAQEFSGMRPRCITACRGRVVIGRDGHSMLFSPDSGESWQDLGYTDRIPEDMSTVWALAYPDSVREPMRVLGVASFQGYQTGYAVHLIESTDAGASWTRGVRLPALELGLGQVEPYGGISGSELDFRKDYAANWNAISFQFVPNRSGTGSTGFASVQRGMVRSTDGGRTWKSICDTITFARVVMADERSGVAASVMTIRKPTALYFTRDGGTTWKWTRTLPSPAHYVIDLGWLAGQSFQALVPDMNRMEFLYRYRTDDGGATWYQNQLRRSGRDALGKLLWLDTADLHAVHEGARILHSTDGGTTFHLLHPPLGESGIVIGSDGSYLYIASWGNALGRWRLVRRWRAVSEAPALAAAGSLSVAPNPARDDLEVTLNLRSVSDVSIAVFDALGRLRSSQLRTAEEPGLRRYRIPLSNLSPGAYLLRAAPDGAAETVRFVIRE